MEEDPAEVMRAAAEAFDRAPVRAVAKVPDSEVRVSYRTQIDTRVEEDRKVTPIRKRKGGKRS